jgi:hypothetical protein
VTTDPMERAINRALLSLGDMGGPIPEHRAVVAVGPAVADALVDRGLMTVSEPIYTLTDEGLRRYAEVSARRNAEADR